MTKEELIELKENITELDRLVGFFGLAFESETGKLRLHYNGEYYKIKNIIKRIAGADPKLQASADRALILVDDINERMEQYIRDYGKLPPELYTH